MLPMTLREKQSFYGEKITEDIYKPDQIQKIVEGVTEMLIRQQENNDEISFLLMLRRGSTNAVFTLRLLQKKFSQKEGNVLFLFVDSQETLDRVPGDVV